MPESTPFKVHRRFDRIARLTGVNGLESLHNAHVMVVGLGGVGSYAAEGLARSGVGRLSLVDFDMVCVTNSNRQIQAMKGKVGQLKANVLAERLQTINPQATIKAIPLFYDKRTSDLLLKGKNKPDFVVDAIDNVTAKCHLINACRQLDIPLVVSTGASGRWDPTQIATADLTKTKVDPLAATVRKILRKQYDFPRNGKWHIPAVYSAEPLQDPVVLPYDKNGDFQCVCPSGENTYHNCEERNVIWGTAGFVTSVFGMTCASVVVRIGESLSSESRLYAEVHASGDRLYLPLDEIEHRVKIGQIGLDAHILCPALTGDTPKPLWMLERFVHCADTPEARMMDHLRANKTPVVALVGLLLIVVSGLLQQRGWFSVSQVSVGWSSITLHDRWWTPWGYCFGSLDWMHWVGNGVLYYFCAQRVERIVGSHSLLLHLSCVLLGSALAVWWLESNLVVGASTLVFGLWAMQVGWGFRLAHSLPPKLQSNYGWGNFIVFAPALVLNTLSADVSHVAHWAAMGIGGALSIWSRPITRQTLINRSYKRVGVSIVGVHLLFLSLFWGLSKIPLEYTHREVSDAGFSLPIPNRFVSESLCGAPSWNSDGMTMYSTGRWLTVLERKGNEASKPSIIVEEWYDCGVEQLTCREVGKSTISTHDAIQTYPDDVWSDIECTGDFSTSERVLLRGELLLRMGCMYDSSETKIECEKWLSDVTLGETQHEKKARQLWKQDDQRGDVTLNYAQQMIRVGELNQADALLKEVEARFDAYRWRGTEARLRLHLDHPRDWPLEREWLEKLVDSLPVDEVEVLRLLVIHAGTLGWCDISEGAWNRWRRMMPTGLDEVGGLVNQCSGD